MVKKLIEKLGLALVAVARDSHDAADAAEKAREKQAFEQGAKSIVAGGAPSIQTGAVQLLGMAEVERELGRAWPEVRSRAHRVSRSTIERHLGEGDVVSRRDDGTYILCFAGADHGHARTTVESIVREIKETLLQEVPETAGVEVGHKVVEVGTESLAEEGDSLLDTIGAALDQVKSEAETSREDGRRVLAKASVLYDPVWNVRKESVSLFRCLLDESTSRFLVDRLRGSSDSATRQRMLADVDNVILGRAIPDLHALLQAGAKAMVIVPVSYSTLHSKPTRETYLALCNRMPAQYAQYVVFELCGIPSRARQARVAELLVSLKPYSSLRIVEAGAKGMRVEQIGRCGAFAVSIDLDSVEHLIDLRGLVATCNKFNLRTVLYNARTAGLLSGAISAGAGFVSGPAVSAKLQKPRGSYQLTGLVEAQNTVHA